MAATSNPSVNELFECPLDFDKNLKFPPWTEMPSYSPATSRTLQWSYRVLEYIETNCTDIAFVEQFKEVPLYIGTSIADETIR
jgi:hypothetical protein